MTRSLIHALRIFRKQVSIAFIYLFGTKVSRITTKIGGTKHIQSDESHMVYVLEVQFLTLVHIYIFRCSNKVGNNIKNMAWGNVY